MIAGAFASTDHPLLAHIIPIRRCNLACEYCNEFDDFSKPVPTEVMFQRVDRLAALGTSVITISGGEPLLHPELDQVIARIRKRGMIAGMITNGYLLVADRIERLNRAVASEMKTYAFKKNTARSVCWSAVALILLRLSIPRRG